ncbi:MAG TPA: hypothetical protein VHX64_15675 [Caulobacteraceae bacterium]|nr:hypothetical protein [Caulobacteraceae bacterium]
MRLRHTLVVLAGLPVLLFALLPLAPMSLAFDGPSLTASWSFEA